MKFISWNVNGIRAAVKHGFPSVLQNLKPDFMGLQEIKIDDQARAKENFDFVGYEEYFNPAAKKGYSGTAILATRPVTVVNGLGIEEFDREGRVQTVDVGPVYFVNAYFPNAQPDLKRLDFKERFNDAFLEHALALQQKKPVVLTGDFNVAHQEIDLARPKENVGNAGFTTEERYWADRFAAAGFVDSFRHLHPERAQYSWWSYRAGVRTKNIGWRIDYFWLSPTLLDRLKAAYIEDQITGSDHAPIGLELDI